MKLHNWGYQFDENIEQFGSQMGHTKVQKIRKMGQAACIFKKHKDQIGTIQSADLLDGTCNQH